VNAGHGRHVNPATGLFKGLNDAVEHGEFADTLETEQAVNQQDGVFGGDVRVHEDESRLLV
jgi:hypothetical protein